MIAKKMALLPSREERRLAAAAAAVEAAGVAVVAVAAAVAVAELAAVEGAAAWACRLSEGIGQRPLVLDTLPRRT